MPTYLVVANQTLANPALIDEIRQRLEDDATEFHVVVPATPVVHRLTWDEGETQAAAQRRLDTIIDRIRALGGQASGEIGVSDPVDAVHDAIRGRSVDGVILSTLPQGVSRWLGQDVPGRLRDSLSVPVTVVTAAPEAASAGP
jgi:GABA permease